MSLSTLYNLTGNFLICYENTHSTAFSKMLKLTIITLTVAIFAASAFPATEDNKLDKATQIDVSVNSVTPKVKEDDKKEVPPKEVSITSSGTIGISAPGDNGPAFIPLPPPPKIRPGNTFARFIDDVFQIPISVLQSVTKLLTNPFTQLRKDVASSQH
ncbi:hypothetical protein CBL_12273 [Carabus blaptoides fortunei]